MVELALSIKPIGGFYLSYWFYVFYLLLGENEFILDSFLSGPPNTLLPAVRYLD